MLRGIEAKKSQIGRGEALAVLKKRN